MTVGEGGVGHDEAIVPLGNGGLGGGADPATRDNTLVTLENTAAINRLVAIMRPISERAATARASIEGAFPGHYQGEGGTGGGYETATPQMTAPSTAPIAAVPGVNFASNLPDAMKGDVEGRGPSGGRFNVGGSQLAPASELTTVTLANGQAVTVNKRVAGQFQGFFNDLISAGAPVRSLGGANTRGNPSQHPWGGAVDWAQSRRNRVDPQVQAWINQNPTILNALEKRWGMGGGEHWRNPDTGHFSIDRIYGTEHLTAAQKESAEALAGAKKMQHGGVVKAKQGGTPVILGEGGEDEYVIPSGQLAGHQGHRAERDRVQQERSRQNLLQPAYPPTERCASWQQPGRTRSLATDWGFYQTNARDVEEAVKLGVPRDIAQHLTAAAGKVLRRSSSKRSPCISI